MTYFTEIANRGARLRREMLTAPIVNRLHRELADLAHDPSARTREVVVAELETIESQIEIHRLVVGSSTSQLARTHALRDVGRVFDKAEDFLTGMNAAVSHARHLRHIRDDREGREATKNLREEAALVIARIRQNLVVDR